MGVCFDGLCIFAHDVADARARQGATVTVEKQRPVSSFRSVQMLVPLIGAQQLDRGSHQGDQTAFASFAHDADLGGRFKAHVSGRQIDQLLDPDRRVIEQGEQCRIAPPLRRVQSWSSQHLLYLFRRQVVDVRMGWRAFAGDREYALALQQTIRLHILQVSEE